MLRLGLPFPLVIKLFYHTVHRYPRPKTHQFTSFCMSHPPTGDFHHAH